MVVDPVDALVPGIVLLGAVAATVYTDLHPDGIRNATSAVVEKVEEKTEEVVQTQEAAVPTASADEGEAEKKTKSTTDLVKQVASTVKDQRETQERVAARKAAEAKAREEEAAAAAAAAEEGAVETVEQAIEREEEEEEGKTTGKKRRLALRVIKKVVAPWRKWENIK